MRRLAFVAMLFVCAGAATAATPTTWTSDGWYRLEIFPTLTIQGGPFVTEKVCVKTLSDNGDIVKCAHLANAGDEVDVALAFFGDAIKLNPRDAASMNYRGLLYSRRQEYDRAIAEHTAAIKADPDDFWAFAFRGAVYQTMGRKAEAEEDYRSALGRNPGDPGTVARLKSSLRSLGVEP